MSSFLRNLTGRSFSAGHIQSTIQLEPGLVLIKNGLAPEEQVHLAKKALDIGDEPIKGFWTLENGQKRLNSQPWRGRMFGHVSSFPSLFTELCVKHLQQANQLDSSLIFQKPTHLILLYYQSLPNPPKGGYIPTHRDNGENDGEENSAVVSFSIGDSCDFLVSHTKPILSPSGDPKNLAHKIYLESGDVTIFGGKCRYIYHSIPRIHQATAPNFLPFQGARLNFTFRYAPKIIGQEERFATISADKLPRNNPFYKLDEMDNLKSG